MTTLTAKKQVEKEVAPDHQVVITFSKQDAKVAFIEGLWTRAQVEMAYRAMVKELRTHISEKRREDGRARSENQ